MIEFLTNNFNNRELASYCWFVVISIILFFGKSFRTAMWNVVRSVFGRTIFTIIILNIVYVVGMILFLKWIGFWQSSMLKSSIYWFFGTAVVSTFNISNASTDKKFFKNIVIDNLKFVILIEFVVTIRHFGFWGEIFFLPFVTMIALIQVYAENKVEHKQTHSLMTIILAVILIVLIVLSVIDLVQSIQDYANYDTLSLFVFPVILGACFIPFLFILAVLIKYEQFLKNFTNFIEDKKMLRYARKKAKKYYKLNFRLIHSDTQRIMQGLCTSISKEEIDKLFSDNHIEPHK